MRPSLHVTEDPFFLKLPLEDSERFFYVVSKNFHFHNRHPLSEPATAGRCELLPRGADSMPFADDRLILPLSKETTQLPLRQARRGLCPAAPGEAGRKYLFLDRLFACYYTHMGFRHLSSGSREKRPHAALGSERSLAAAILKQAWQEAIIDLLTREGTSQTDYTLLKEKAIEWIFSDDEGFLYWCQLADVDHTEIQLKLRQVLSLQNYRGRMACRQ